MEDRELLWFAAKAVGFEVLDWYGERYSTTDGETLFLWNPLFDDGDALRLAVKLDMNVFQAAKSAYALPSDDDGTYEMEVRHCDAGGDKCAATRRAIVRAAAEIGRSMPD